MSEHVGPLLHSPRSFMLRARSPNIPGRSSVSASDSLQVGLKSPLHHVLHQSLGFLFRIYGWGLKIFGRPSLLAVSLRAVACLMKACQTPEALALVSYGSHHYFTPVPVPSFRASSPLAPCTLPGIARCVPAVPASPPSLCVILLTLHASVARVCGHCAHQNSSESPKGLQTGVTFPYGIKEIALQRQRP